METQKTQEQPANHEMSFDEFKLMIKDFNDQENSIQDEYYDKKIEYSQMTSKLQEHYQSFIDKLINEKEKFSKVFETEKGSIYFVSADGHSLRFQPKETEPSKWKKYPLLSKTIFIDSTQVENLLQLKRSDLLQEEIIGMEIKKQKYTTDMHPFEFGSEGFPEINYVEKNESITIEGDEYKSFSSGYHIGHKISKIFK